MKDYAFVAPGLGTAAAATLVLLLRSMPRRLKDSLLGLISWQRPAAVPDHHLLVAADFNRSSSSPLVADSD